MLRLPQAFDIIDVLLHNPFWYLAQLLTNRTILLCLRVYYEQWFFIARSQRILKVGNVDHCCLERSLCKTPRNDSMIPFIPLAIGELKSAGCLYQALNTVEMVPVLDWQIVSYDQRLS